MRHDGPAAKGGAGTAGAGCPLVVGIDGGGSTTRIVALDQTGRIVATARGSGINPLDKPNWQEELAEALRPVLALPGIVAVAAGLPAHGEAEAISNAQRSTLARLAGDRRQIVLNDVDVAQIGAFAGAAGILLLSGTGSMAWARDAEGRSHRTGGWGDVIGDEGSSHWIGHRILERVSKSLDGRAAPTALVDAVLAHLGVPVGAAMNGIENWISRFTHPRSEIAALAPLATDLAEKGDAAAQAIVAAAAHELAAHVRAIAAKLGNDLAWSYAGGTFASCALLEAVTTGIGRPPVPPRLPPIGGALLAAARLADWPTDEAWIERLVEALRTISFDNNHTLKMTA